MKDDVLIKSNKYGITIYFNSDNSFEELLDDVKKHYTYYRSLTLNKAERMRLFAIHHFPFGVYRIIEQARRKKHFRSNMK